jgi:hypothetical protein
MIKLSGSLSVKSINGRNGAFSVGKLTTPVGEFTVKDTILDQYPEGKYDGEFLISKIFPYSYVMRGNVVVEVRCILDEAIINQADEGEQQDTATPVAPDPLDEEKVRTATPVCSESVTPAGGAGKEQAEGAGEIEFSSEQARLDCELFGDLYSEIAMLADGIKLDPTVGREKFRNQRDRLKELGYRFDSTTQSWSKPL